MNSYIIIQRYIVYSEMIVYLVHGELTDSIWVGVSPVEWWVSVALLSTFSLMLHCAGWLTGSRGGQGWGGGG